MRELMGHRLTANETAYTRIEKAGQVSRVDESGLFDPSMPDAAVTVDDMLDNTRMTASARMTMDNALDLFSVTSYAQLDFVTGRSL
jgi:hypothetical protein